MGWRDLLGDTGFAQSNVGCQDGDPGEHSYGELVGLEGCMAFGVDIPKNATMLVK